MKRLQQGYLILFCSLFSVGLFAEHSEPEDKNPLGCKNLGYQFQLKTLDVLASQVGERQSLYFIYNALSTPVHLYQMRAKDAPEGMSLNHTIPPKEWAALATDEKEVKYACTVDDKKYAYGRVVDCGQSIKICEFARVKYGLNNRGNYWMVKGSNKSGALHEVNYYGIIAR